MTPRYSICLLQDSWWCLSLPSSRWSPTSSSYSRDTRAGLLNEGLANRSTLVSFFFVQSTFAIWESFLFWGSLSKCPDKKPEFWSKIPEFTETKRHDCDSSQTEKIGNKLILLLINRSSEHQSFTESMEIDRRTSVKRKERNLEPPRFEDGIQRVVQKIQSIQEERDEVIQLIHFTTQRVSSQSCKLFANLRTFVAITSPLFRVTSQSVH